MAEIIEVDFVKFIISVIVNANNPYGRGGIQIITCIKNCSRAYPNPPQKKQEENFPAISSLDASSIQHPCDFAGARIEPQPLEGYLRKDAVDYLITPGYCMGVITCTGFMYPALLLQIYVNRYRVFLHSVSVLRGSQ